MPKKTLPSVLIFTTSEGHYSIAQAAAETLTSIARPTLYFYEEPALAMYRFFYRYAPFLFTVIFKASFLPLSQFISQKFLIRHHLKRVREQVLHHRPSVIVNTSFGFTPALEVVSKEQNIPVINLVPNPRSFFYQDISDKITENLVFDKKAQKAALALKPNAKITAAGWLVRESFKPLKADQRRDLQKQLNLDHKKPVLLISTGSEGTDQIKKSIAALEKLSLEFQAVVACGNNQNLIEYVTQKTDRRFSALAFTPFLNLYTQAADLIIGKAGPNSLFEAVACHVPFIATTHVGGLETGNLELITEYQLGLLASDPNDLPAAVKSLLEPTKTKQKIMTGIKEMSEYNHQTKKVFKEMVGEMLRS